MDEENNGFSIPANRPMFDEGDVGIEARPVPQSDLFMVFANDEGNKAVILTPIEIVDDEVLERHGREELESYADALFETGDDPMDLQIGGMYEGETAEADAQAEAFRLDEEYSPGDDASDEDLAAAVGMAKEDVGGADETLPFPEDMEGGEEVGLPLPEANEEAPEDLGVEEEPMLEQLKKKPVK